MKQENCVNTETALVINIVFYVEIHHLLHFLKQRNYLCANQFTLLPRRVKNKKSNHSCCLDILLLFWKVQQNYHITINQA